MANQNTNQTHNQTHNQPPEIEIVRFKAGDLLFEEDELTFHFFIIQEGEVEVFKRGAGGDEVKLALVNSGTSIGEFAMIDRKPRSASARALTDLLAARVSPEAYEQLLGELPDWAVSVMRALVERVRHTNEIVRALQVGLEKSSPGSSLSAQIGKAVDAAEYSDFSRRSRIRKAESDETVTDFDFSVYEDSKVTELKVK